MAPESAGDELQRRILHQLPAHNQTRSEALCSQYRKSAYLAHTGSLAHAGVAEAEDFGRDHGCATSMSRNLPGCVLEARLMPD